MTAPLYEPGPTNPALDPATCAAFDAFAKATGAMVREKQSAFLENNGEFDPETDMITIRERSQWKNRPVGYYCTLAHELIHWTGPRLGRIGLKEPTPKERALEELVADYGSVALTKHFGVYAHRSGGNDTVLRHLEMFADHEATLKVVQAEVALAVMFLLRLAARNEIKHIDAL